MPSPTQKPPASTDKPAVRITRRGEAKRAAILETAAGMFLANGYDGVSVDEIVKACGGSKTNVYSYFGGKDGLFVAVVEALCDRFLEKVEQMEPSCNSTAQGLHVLARGFLESLLQDSHLAFLRLIIAEARRFPEIGQVWYTRGPLATCQFIAAYLARQQAAGTKLNTTPEVAAQHFHSMVIAGVLHRTLATGQRPGEAQIDALIASAIDLIVARPGAAG
ncbi:TetR family transcriptional regulator [Cupriavidus sp. USMAA2-4]|uniref:TetR/AcrR family transcriptional regulator n=1 Tax=Cupriavidus sp. USMAA2-4 TaxID=876364 RepID=UPI0008A6DF31|nr:TetR/AcrR family transcriptional regulator [Cupriavidus sp. USMAA2-4]AOY94689.1 TetR family transcriptional regulator [Cupriavidus sp. USMAA2-4]